MKKLLVLILTICFMFTIVGCSSKEKNKNESEFYPKAVAILDEFKDDQRIIDFRKAYDLLTTLPSDDDDFVEQLSAVNKICKKYKLKLKYGNGIIIDSKYGRDIKQDTINNYIKTRSLKDAEKIMQSLVYPVLFEKYGYDAQRVNGLYAYQVSKTFNSFADCKFNLTINKGTHLQDNWYFKEAPKSRLGSEYYENGLVRSVWFPIARSTNPLDSNNSTLFYKQEPETKKRILSDRIEEMLPQINLLNSRYKYLKNIFTDDELTILNNYITSLKVSDIWENDFYKKKFSSSALMILKYKTNTIYISYNIDDITMQIIGNNKVNKLSYKWSTLLCGLIYYDNNSKAKEYHNEITNNISANETMKVGAYDLEVIAEKYLSITPTSNQTSTNNSTLSKTDVIIDTKYYTVKIPPSWSNDCTYKITETDNHAYNLTFYEKLSHQRNSDGQLFTIMLCPGFEDYTKLPEYNYLGNLKVKELGSFNVIITYPTDITFAEEYVEKYNDMKEAIPYILKNITLKDGYTFSKEPIK